MRKPAGSPRLKRFRKVQLSGLPGPANNAISPEIISLPEAGACAENIVADKQARKTTDPTITRIWRIFFIAEKLSVSLFLVQLLMVKDGQNSRANEYDCRYVADQFFRQSLVHSLADGDSDSIRCNHPDCAAKPNCKKLPLLAGN